MTENKHYLRYKKLAPDAIGITSPAMLGDAGYDLYCYETTTVKAKGSASIKTMVAIELDEGYWFEIMPKSGLATKHDIAVHNGVIDNGYRGEIIIHVYNHGNQDYVFNKNDKVAQGIIRKLYHFSLKEETELSSTERNEKGFGSTGK